MFMFMFMFISTVSDLRMSVKVWSKVVEEVMEVETNHDAELLTD